MSEAAEVKQAADDKLWEQTGKDQASTIAEEVVVPAKEAPVADAADPMAGLPEPTRKLIEGLQTKTAEFDGRFRTVNQQLATAHGTIGNLKQRLDESQVRLQTMTPTIEAVEADKKAAAKAVADAKAQKRKALRERLSDLPDVAELMDEVLPADAEPAEVKAAKPPEVKTEIHTEIKPDAPSHAEQVRVLTLQRELSDKVPGWMKIRNSAEFQAWLPAQSAGVKANAESWDVDAAASVFAAFDKHKSDAATVAKVEADRQARLRRGENIQGRGGPNQTVDTSADALWKQTGRDFEKARSA